MLVLFQYHNLIFSALSELPAFLVKDGGLNSGFMLAHCTAAALGIFDQYLITFSASVKIAIINYTQPHVSKACANLT